MNKPMIRHCYNCKYSKDVQMFTVWGDPMFVARCYVRFKNIQYPRLRALTCRFYEQNEVNQDD